MYRIGRHLVTLVCFAAALAGSTLHAQTITIGPGGYLTAGPGGTQQFTAMVTGGDSMMSTVTWLAGGKAGGNSTFGTISSTGLYTAPMAPTASGQVQITAILGTSSAISASTYIYLLPAGPTITSVSPNPLPVGTDTITVNRIRFRERSLDPGRRGPVWVHLRQLHDDRYIHLSGCRQKYDSHGEERRFGVRQHAHRARLRNQHG